MAQCASEPHLRPEMALPLLGQPQHTAKETKVRAVANAVIRCAVRVSFGSRHARIMDDFVVKLEGGTQHACIEEKEQPWLAVNENVFAAPQPVMTETESTLALVNLLLNYGILSIPFAFVFSGYFALPLLWIVVGLCYCSAQLLGEVLQELRGRGISRPDYSDMATALSGPMLASFIGFVANAEIIVYAWGNLLIIGRTLPRLLSVFALEDTIAACSVCTLVLSAIPDKFYSYGTGIAAISLLMACMLVLASGWQLPEWAEEPRLHGSIIDASTSMALVLFSCGTHPVLPFVFENTSGQEEFKKVTWNSWAIYTTVCSVFGCFAYYMFGDSLYEVATQNIGLDLDLQPLPAGKSFVQMCAAFLMFKLQLSQVQTTRPFANAVARCVGFELKNGNGGWRSFVVTVPVVLVFGAGAYAVRNSLKELECIAGSTIMSMNSLLFPGLAYLGVCRPEKPLSRLCGVTVTLGGAIVMFGPLLASLKF